MVKEGILAPFLQNLVGLLPRQVQATGEQRGQAAAVWKGVSELKALPVSPSPPLQGAPQPLGHNPQALLQSPTETS